MLGGGGGEGGQPAPFSLHMHVHTHTHFGVVSKTNKRDYLMPCLCAVHTLPETATDQGYNNYTYSNALVTLDTPTKLYIIKYVMCITY